MNSITAGIIGVLLGIIGLLYLYLVNIPINERVSFTGSGGITAPKCNVTFTKAAVGDDLSTAILSQNANRAWAIIQQPQAATNTVTLSFDEGEAAVFGSGYQLASTTVSTPSEQDETPPFGRNADFAYMDEVEAITSTGTTTVNIIECVYPQ